MIDQGSDDEDAQGNAVRDVLGEEARAQRRRRSSTEFVARRRSSTGVVARRRSSAAPPAPVDPHAAYVERLQAMRLMLERAAARSATSVSTVVEQLEARAPPRAGVAGVGAFRDRHLSTPWAVNAPLERHRGQASLVSARFGTVTSRRLGL